MRRYVAAWLAVWLLPFAHGLVYSDAKRDALKEEVGELFRHGFQGYMRYAYPADELKSVSCKPSYRLADAEQVGINDIHANVSMTLLDVLSALPLIDPTSYPDALQKVATEVSFDQDVKVQVFELTIRALGALLSTVQYLDALPPDVAGQAGKLGISESAVGGDLKRFRGRILELAVDLGERLLPAFETLTGLPYSRINLRKGVEKGEGQNTCAAGAGSLTLEFAVLSRLTGDKRFETRANKAYIAVWNRASSHGLVGNTIGVSHGQWLIPGMSGIGAGIDSFFEYGIKTGILLNDDSFLDIFYDSYAAIQTHIRSPDGFIYRPAQYQTLRLGTTSSIDSLSAFVSGMQVLAGDLESAIRSHLVFWNLWRRYSALPESWDWRSRAIEWDGWPGRPEFIESTYYLYKATGDPFYLKVGERFLKDLKKRIKTKCGFASLSNIQTGQLQDRMESFVLSETLKYLYLLFDRTPSKLDSNQVYSTEGHPLSLPIGLLQAPSPTRRILHRGEVLQCPAYVPPTRGGLTVGIEQRQDYEYARKLVFGNGDKALDAEDGEVFWSVDGFCAKPSVPPFTIDISLLPPGHDDAQTPVEDLSPSSSKIRQDEATGDYCITDVTGLRLTLRWRLDNQGYNVASIGPRRVRTGQQVIVTDSKMRGYLPVPSPAPDPQSYQSSELILRFSNVIRGQKQVVLHALGATATFGRDFDRTKDAADGWRIGGGSVPIVLLPDLQRYSCGPLRAIGDLAGKILLVERGECTFVQKMTHAQAVGAAGVIVMDQQPDTDQRDDQYVFQDGSLLRPSSDLASAEELQTLSELREEATNKGETETGMIFVTSLVGDMVKKSMGTQGGSGETVVDLMFVDGGFWEEDDGWAGGVGGGGKDEAAQPREGRLAVGEWEIFNLKIVEVPGPD